MPALDPDTPPRLPAPHLRPDGLVLVLLGGALGTAARYGLARVWPTSGGHWPLGTFLANVVGSFVLGALLELLQRSGPDAGWRQRVRVCAGTGCCGGLTTYSTLAVETDLLTRSHDGGLALGYLAGSVVAGLVAVAVGMVAAARALR